MNHWVQTVAQQAGEECSARPALKQIVVQAAEAIPYGNAPVGSKVAVQTEVDAALESFLRRHQVKCPVAVVCSG